MQTAFIQERDDVLVGSVGSLKNTQMYPKTAILRNKAWKEEQKIIF